MFKWLSLPLRRKCLVALCPNWSNEGKFEGPICMPCAEVLRGHRDGDPFKHIALRIHVSVGLEMLGGHSP